MSPSDCQWNRAGNAGSGVPAATFRQRPASSASVWVRPCRGTGDPRENTENGRYYFPFASVQRNSHYA